ncbi:MAG: CBS domain-containing protein [Halobacteriota archaeon]
MNVEEVVSTEYEVFEPDARVSKLKGYFQDTHDKAVLVVGDDGYEGVVTRRQLISSHFQPGAKLRSIAVHPPKTNRHEDVREVARLMVETDSKVVPVFEGDGLYGVVTADDLLAHVNSHLEVLDVEDVYTSQLVSVDTETSVGAVINRFREHGISRVPVFERDDLVGIVTLYDLLGFSVRDEDPGKGGGGIGDGTGDGSGDHGGFGPRHGDVDRMLDIPAEDVMNSPVLTVEPEADLDEAVSTMLENDYSCLVVEDGDSAVGVITKTDVLRSLTWEEEDGGLNVQVTNADLLGTVSREEVSEMVTDVTDKYAEMQVLHAHLHLKRHKEQLRGNNLIHSRLSVYTNKGQFLATGEGYGTRHSIKLARDRLERKILEEKGVKRSDRDAERLFKEIGF